MTLRFPTRGSLTAPSTSQTPSTTSRIPPTPINEAPHPLCPTSGTNTHPSITAPSLVIMPQIQIPEPVWVSKISRTGDLHTTGLIAEEGGATSGPQLPRLIYHSVSLMNALGLARDWVVKATLTKNIQRPTHGANGTHPATPRCTAVLDVTPTAKASKWTHGLKLMQRH